MNRLTFPKLIHLNSIFLIDDNCFIQIINNKLTLDKNYQEIYLKLIDEYEAVILQKKINLLFKEIQGRKNNSNYEIQLLQQQFIFIIIQIFKKLLKKLEFKEAQKVLYLTESIEQKSIINQNNQSVVFLKLWVHYCQSLLFLQQGLTQDFLNNINQHLQPYDQIQLTTNLDIFNFNFRLSASICYLYHMLKKNKQSNKATIIKLINKETITDKAQIQLDQFKNDIIKLYLKDFTYSLKLYRQTQSNLIKLQLTDTIKKTCDRFFGLISIENFMVFIFLLTKLFKYLKNSANVNKNQREDLISFIYNITKIYQEKYLTKKQQQFKKLEEKLEKIIQEEKKQKVIKQIQPLPKQSELIFPLPKQVEVLKINQQAIKSARANLQKRQIRIDSHSIRNRSKDDTKPQSTQSSLLSHRLQKRQFQKLINNISSSQSFWIQVQNIKTINQVRKMSNKDNNLENLKICKNKLYQQLKQLHDVERQEREKKKQIEQQQLIEEEKIRQQIEQEKQRKLKQQQLFEEEKKKYRQITIYDVLMALQLRQMHFENPTSHKLPYLISKHFISLLIYEKLKEKNLFHQLVPIQDYEKIIQEPLRDYKSQKKLEQFQQFQLQIDDQVKQIQSKSPLLIKRKTMSKKSIHFKFKINSFNNMNEVQQSKYQMYQQQHNKIRKQQKEVEEDDSNQSFNDRTRQQSQLIQNLQDIKKCIVKIGYNLIIKINQVEDFLICPDFKYCITISSLLNQKTFKIFTRNTNILENMQKLIVHQYKVQKCLIYSQLYKLINQTSQVYGNFLQNVGVSNLYKPQIKAKFNRFVLMPNYNKLKVMLIGNDHNLLTWFNRLKFRFLFKQNQIGQIYVKVTVYYSNFDDNQINFENTEKYYHYDGNNLFLHFEIYELDSKLRKYKIIVNKFDLKTIFDFNPELNYQLTPNLIYFWTKSIIQMIKFDRRYIYKVPQFKSSYKNNQPINDFSQEQQSNRSQDDFLEIEGKQISHRITNNFQNNVFNNNKIQKQFFNSFYKEFRIIGHFVQKLYIVTNQNQNYCQIYTQSKYFSKIQKSPLTTFQVEYAIITVKIHNILDYWIMVLYFPKSKRKLMSYLNILNFQDMYFSDIKIFDLLNFSTNFNNIIELEHLVKDQAKGRRAFRKQSALNRDLLNRMKHQSIFSLGKEQSFIQQIQQFRQRRVEGSLQAFVQGANEYVIRNKLLQQTIKENTEKQEKIEKFIKFSKRISYYDNNLDFNDVNSYKIIEIKIWSNLLSHVICLNKSENKYLHTHTNLEDRMIEYLNEKKGIKTRNKIIGKNYLLKRQIVQNPQNLYLSLFQIHQSILRIKLIQTYKPDYKPPYCFQIGDEELSVIELISNFQIKIERMGQAYIEFFLEKVEENQENYSSRKQQMVIQDTKQIFQPLTPIKYSYTSNYILHIRFFALLKKVQYKDIKINLREILNLFIADGLFKSQTNYMNKKLNLSDIMQMCHYIAYKIQTQNFLNLANLAITDPPEYEVFMNATEDENVVNQHNDNEGYVYTRIMNHKKERVLFQFQLFKSMQKVIINIFWTKSSFFQQEQISFGQIEKRIPFFRILVNSGMQYQALKRFGEQQEQLNKYLEI